MTRTTMTVALAAAATLMCAGAASAHVEFEPATAPAGHLELLTAQVPNESADSATVSVSVQIPDGIDLVRFVPKPGWTRTVTTAALAQATTVGADTVTKRITSVTWSKGQIAPGEIETFQMSVFTPDQDGATLAFPTVQTYADGKAVRWIGPADSAEPAPTMTISAAEGDGHGAAAGDGASDDGHSDDTTAMTALILGIVGLAVGLGALVIALRGRRPAS